MTTTPPITPPDETSDLLRQLQATNESLLKRVAQLEGLMADPPNTVDADPVDIHPSRGVSMSRRSLLATAGVGALASAAGFVVARPVAARAASTGNPLTTRESFGPGTIVGPALDTNVGWSRTDPVGVAAHHTNEILSLVSQNNQVNSYSWPFFIQLIATTASAATHESSQSAGASVYLYNRSTGDPWATGYHSEAHHGQDPDNTPHSTNVTTIGYNMELTRPAGGGTAIGVEVLNKPSYTDQNGTSHTTYAGTTAVNIDGLWSYGVRITNPSTPSSAVRDRTVDPAHTQAATTIPGSAAIKIEAPFETGIDAGPNHIMLHHGQKLILDNEHGVFLTYNRETSQIEMHKGNQKTAAW